MNKKSRADFHYRLTVFDNHKVLLICDQDLGNMSVTNDIENVVSDIALHEGIDPEDYLIFYKDSLGYWDGWDASSKDFYCCRLPETFIIAMPLTLNNLN